MALQDNSFDGQARLGLKRKLSAVNKSAAKKIKSEPKNAVCALHMRYRGLDFKVVEQEGPVHMPLFTISVEINGCVFTGKGKNKKMAKHAAAEAALRSLVQVENPSDSSLLVGFPPSTDFSDDVTMSQDGGEFSAAKSGSIPGISSGGDMNGSEKHTGAPDKTIIKNKLSGEKGPVMLLNELHPKAKFLVMSDCGEQYNKYKMCVIIDNVRFEGIGPSKKLSKAAAARAALANLYNLSSSHSHISPSAPTAINLSMRPLGSSTVPQVFADHVANLVTDKFASLMADDIQHGKRKVLAGIVMSRGFELSSCRVISVSTGTKCIKGEHMSVSGAALHDCHAEIIARRCLNKFLYDELGKHSQPETASSSIFEPFKAGVGFQVKDGYKFVLFISTAPCGDSRLFSPHDEEGQDKHPNRKARGKLRTKIESGEGTIPVKSNEGVQTWDGVLQGERLLTMSCSDKIAKWNVVGLQGALLSNLIQPVYLEAVILGSLFHPEHLYRAVCGRVEQVIVGLPPPYRLNKPRMALISSKEVRHTGKAPSFSVNWTEGDANAEIVNAVTGKTEDHKVSRLSKSVFFKRYIQSLRSLPSLLKENPTDVPLTYSENKELCFKYQAAKKQLYEAFVKAEQGTWVKKPPETEGFEMESSLTSVSNC